MQSINVYSLLEATPHVKLVSLHSESEEPQCFFPNNVFYIFYIYTFIYFYYLIWYLNKVVYIYIRVKYLNTSVWVGETFTIIFGYCTLTGNEGCNVHWPDGLDDSHCGYGITWAYHIMFGCACWGHRLDGSWILGRGFDHSPPEEGVSLKRFKIPCFLNLLFPSANNKNEPFLQVSQKK